MQEPVEFNLDASVGLTPLDSVEKPVLSTSWDAVLSDNPYCGAIWNNSSSPQKTNKLISPQTNLYMFSNSLEIEALPNGAQRFLYIYTRKINNDK